MCIIIALRDSKALLQHIINPCIMLHTTLDAPKAHPNLRSQSLRKLSAMLQTSTQPTSPFDDVGLFQQKQLAERSADSGRCVPIARFASPLDRSTYVWHIRSDPYECLLYCASNQLWFGFLRQCHNMLGMPLLNMFDFTSFC